jgi:probable phosphoglycerate mutase
VPRRLLLVRHGESTWNALSRWQGQADPPLSPFGERQAEDAAARLAELATITAVWASDLVRARRTAELVAGHLGIATVREEPRLRERDVGSWSGLTRDEIEERWPGYLASRRSPPDFEGDDELLARTRAGLAAAVDGGDPGDVLVVTHGGVIRTIERSLGAIPERLPNLGGRWLVVASSTELSLGERVVPAKEMPKRVSQEPCFTREHRGVKETAKVPPAGAARA